MAEIPYIPILRPDETETTQKGVYVVYLFDTEANQLYLTLNQGATEAQRASGLAGPPYAVEILKRHATAYRSLLDPPAQFNDGSSELTERITADGKNEKISNAENYNKGTIVYRAYDLNEVGKDSHKSLVDDLTTIVEFYDQFLEQLYSDPEFEDNSATLWKISPEGGDEPYWDTWKKNDIASIGFQDEAEFKPGEEIEAPPTPHNSPARQIYNVQRGIEKGDIVIAGAPKTGIDVTWGLGRVTKDYYDTMDEITDPSKFGPEEFEHTRFISVDWHTFSDDGIAVNCLKSGKKLFHNWAVEGFNARLDHFVGSVARRMRVLEMSDSADEVTDGVITTVEVTQREGVVSHPVNQTRNQMQRQSLPMLTGGMNTKTSSRLRDHYTLQMN